MALRTTYSSETWDKVYQAFSEISFVSYDFDSIKQSLVDYTRTYYPEQFNDYIQSSEFISLLELFAYICEQLAYRVDMVAHENFITTAQRKQSILRLAKLISYKATRNIPVRGLVKFGTISTSENVIDSRGINLAGLTITWNDPNNANWKEQFVLVMNRVLNSRFGTPQKSFQIGDVVMDLYSLKNNATSFPNGVYSFTASTGVDSFPMEVVPADIDANGPFEREPDIASSMSIIYSNDGIGDGSDFTGFMAFIKQGVLTRIDYLIEQSLPDRRIEFLPQNVNHTDVWVQKVDTLGTVIERWTQVDTISEQNLVFNDNRTTRRKYEVDTRENDQVAIVFGDGDFSDIPQGVFRFWLRESANRSVVIQKNRIVNEAFGFSYVSAAGNTETCALTFSLTSTLQNGSATESIESIRRSAPSTYYAQNRMVNGQDYNTYLLKDPTILRLKTINRTFAGQPKYIDWNDASGKYENVKLFGDDLVMRYSMGLNTQTSSVSGQSLIDTVIEPLLSTSGVINTLLRISASDPMMRGVVSSPRRSFIEDNRGNLYYDKDGAPVQLLGGVTGDGSLKEKTAIQALIDRHWYGEPIEFVLAAGNEVLARILDPDIFPEDDGRIYASNVPRTVDGVNKYPPGDIGSGLQPIADQEYFALRYNRYLLGIGNGSISILATPTGSLAGEVYTIEVLADGVTLGVRSSTRGAFPAGTVGSTYTIQPAGTSTPVDFFQVVQGTIPFAPGDAFILDTTAVPDVVQRQVNSTSPVNLNGWWELLGFADLPDYVGGILASENFDQKFTTADSPPELKQHSWVIFIKKIRQQPSGTVIGYEVHTRDLKLIVTSENTKFWYNDVDQLLDSETKKRVFDNIKVLRSNLDSSVPPQPLIKSQVYDVVGPISDENGEIDFNSLEIVPTDLLQEDESGDLVADRILQFETFAGNSYEYYLIETPETSIDFSVVTEGVINTTTGEQTVFINGDEVLFAPAATVGVNVLTGELLYGRRLRMPRLGAGDDGLDFMWQHFSPFTNIIDPSVTNIHDAYVMTRGYYDNVINFIRGTAVEAPTAPTPLELRNAYGYLLDNKMLSDTLVLHPGRIRLLFGGLAEPQLRAKFKVVRSQSATLTNERIKEEILNVINTYFDIGNWDFGDTFYATELISLVHQRLPADVASIVLVPVYSTNSFGALFTVESGHDEILQTAAELGDIEVVEALTPTVIRQS